MVTGRATAGKAAFPLQSQVRCQNGSACGQASHGKQPRFGFNGRDMGFGVGAQQVSPGGRCRHRKLIAAVIAQAGHQVDQPTLGRPVIKFITGVERLVKIFVKNDTHWVVS